MTVISLVFWKFVTPINWYRPIICRSLILVYICIKSHLLSLIVQRVPLQPQCIASLYVGVNSTLRWHALREINTPNRYPCVQTDGKTRKGLGMSKYTFNRYKGNKLSRRAEKESSWTITAVGRDMGIITCSCRQRGHLKLQLLSTGRRWMVKGQTARAMARIHLRECRAFSLHPLLAQSQPLPVILSQYLRPPCDVTSGPRPRQKCIATAK